MEIIVLCILLMLLAILLGILIGMLVSYAREDNNRSGYTYLPQYSTVAVAPASGTVYTRGTTSVASAPSQQLYGTQTAYGRSWRIELWNKRDGRAYAKDFCGQIIIGRGGAGAELFWQMRLGDDITVSREQCVVYDRGGFLVIENISQVNITEVNDIPVVTPQLLQEGSQVKMGRSTYIVSCIQRLS